MKEIKKISRQVIREKKFIEELESDWEVMEKPRVISLIGIEVAVNILYSKGELPFDFSAGLCGKRQGCVRRFTKELTNGNFTKLDY